VESVSGYALLLYTALAVLWSVKVSDDEPKALSLREPLLHISLSVASGPSPPPISMEAARISIGTGDSDIFLATTLFLGRLPEPFRFRFGLWKSAPNVLADDMTLTQTK
jgi:hypothetical protein